MSNFDKFAEKNVIAHNNNYMRLNKPEMNDQDLVTQKVRCDLEQSDEITGHLDFSYDSDFIVDEEYRNSLPDLQNGAEFAGSAIKLERVGIHNFRLPLRFLQRDSAKTLQLEASVTGTVSLEAAQKGINMSRIMRTFYSYADSNVSVDTFGEILLAFKKQLGSFEAHIAVRFSYPIAQNSLRSGLSGFQYYDVVFDMSVDADDCLKKTLHFDFVYSSACPCSFELGEHARGLRNKAVVPHSQRSVARISVKFDEMIWIEDLQELSLRALSTETQVMVKREDEQAFAELNGAHLKFVEDAARLLHQELEKDSRVLDFRILCCHLESLHSHDAVAVAVKGVIDGFSTEVDFHEWRSLLR